MHLFLSALICLQTHFTFHLQLRMNACKFFFLSTLFAQVLTEAKNFHLNVRIMLDFSRFPITLHCQSCIKFICVPGARQAQLFICYSNEYLYFIGNKLLGKHTAFTLLGRYASSV